MGSTISLNTNKCMEAATNTRKLKNVSNTIAMVAMAMEFQFANQCLQAIPHPPKPSSPHATALWKTTTSTPSPSKLLEPTTN